jgi:hypothetical protein
VLAGSINDNFHKAARSKGFSQPLLQRKLPLAEEAR